jgi:hypothetical protein
MNIKKFFKEPARDIPVVQTDVCITGGGTAGCIAALAASRAGAAVILIEKLPVPGGTYTNGGIRCSSFYNAATDPEKAKRIVGGIPYELALRIEDDGGSPGFLPTPNSLYHSPYSFRANHEVYKGVISEMLLEAGVKVCLQTMLCDVELEDGYIKTVFVENKDGRSAIKAKQFIDASGDGDTAKLAGLEQIENWRTYTEVASAPTGLVFGMGGVNFDQVIAENSKAVYPDYADHSLIFVHSVDQERYAPLMELDINSFTSFQFMHPTEATYINNSKGEYIDGTDAEALSLAELKTRVKIMNLANALKQCVPGFENSYMSWASTQLGVRASRITLCDKSISQKEISNATRFEDEIGLFGFHDLSPKRPDCLVKAPGFYGFPYRMLLPKGCRNLFMAGRNVTEENEAHMSTRNVVGCQIMGQGAGVAAALCANNGLDTRDLPYERLRDELLVQKVILGV